MADEVINIAIDEKDVAAAGTPEALTTREISCTSVFIVPKAANTNPMFLVDTNTNTKTLPIPSGGISVPIGNPALIKIDVTTNGEGCHWMAI